MNASQLVPDDALSRVQRANAALEHVYNMHSAQAAYPSTEDILAEDKAWAELHGLTLKPRCSQAGADWAKGRSASAKRRAEDVLEGARQGLAKQRPTGGDDVKATGVVAFHVTVQTCSARAIQPAALLGQGLLSQAFAPSKGHPMPCPQPGPPSPHAAVRRSNAARRFSFPLFKV